MESLLYGRRHPVWEMEALIDEREMSMVRAVWGSIKQERN